MRPAARPARHHSRPAQDRGRPLAGTACPALRAEAMSEPAAPRAAMIADAVATLAVAVAAVLAFGGGIRDVVSGVVISVSWVHGLFVALAIAAVRHAAVPRPSILQTWRSWKADLDRRPALA